MHENTKCEEKKKQKKKKKKKKRKKRKEKKRKTKKELARDVDSAFQTTKNTYPFTHHAIRPRAGKFCCRVGFGHNYDNHQTTAIIQYWRKNRRKQLLFSLAARISILNANLIQHYRLHGKMLRGKASTWKFHT